MEKKAYTILLFNYYRDAELRGADLVFRVINRAENQNIQEKLARHLANAANHAWLWTERICALGGQPIRIDNGYHRQLRRKAGLPTNLLELLALTCVVEERARKRYEEHAARPDVAPETLAILNEMRADEKSQLAWITEKLTELGAKEGQEKVTAALRRYRAIEATVFADMQKEEQQALAAVVQDERVKAQQV
jgi:bacterioferritin (cytochrome b1)